MLKTFHRRSYWVYSAAMFVAWGIILLIRSQLTSQPHMHTLLLVFYGYCIGWLSASIARKIYK